MCIDYIKLNFITRNNHIPLPFTSQILKKSTRRSFYCVLDGYSGHNQIPIYPKDQEKMNFTCPSSIFAYQRTPFGLCNAPFTFSRCITVIFSDYTNPFMEVFMDNFSIFGSSFNVCLANLSTILRRCEEVNLVSGSEKESFPRRSCFGSQMINPKLI